MPSPRSIHLSRSMMVYTAAGMYATAGVDGIIEGFLPGAPPFALAPVVAALMTLTILLTVGSRVPRGWLSLVGPLGVGLVAYAVATTPGPGDGAVLYALPVLWTTLFFGRRGAAAIVTCVGVAHAVALLFLPSGSAYAGRWLDVMASVCAISLVMLVLERSSELLVGQLAAQATTDALTGLLNRRGFADRVALELSRARRDRRPLAMAVFDIDHFKRVNDTWGHQVGDRVLGQFSEILTAQSRDIDVVARLGGEEFVVLLPGIDSQGAHAYTTRVRLALAATRDGGLPLVEVSAGVIIGEADIDIDTMLNNADSALYQAKRTGRNRTMTFRRQTDRCYGRAAAGKGAQEQADAHQNAAKRSERRDASPDTLH